MNTNATITPTVISKNNNEPCHFAAVPPEVTKYILSLATGMPLAKDGKTTFTPNSSFLDTRNCQQVCKAFKALTNINGLEGNAAFIAFRNRIDPESTLREACDEQGN